MPPRPSPTPLADDWRHEMAQAITDPMELISRLDLPPNLGPIAIKAAQLFPLRVPLAYLKKIKPADPSDPLLRQILPLGDELASVSGFSEDPVGDSAATVIPGVLHKYYGRVLLVTTGACAVHCRYCFRRHFPYAQSHVGPRIWEQVLTYLRDDPTTEEVILSGGDPLSLSDEKIEQLVADLETIAHIKRLRIHTRLPVTIPSRATPQLLRTLSKTRFDVAVVMHINHAQEIDSAVIDLCGALRRSGATLLNQAVLLRGVNDNLDALKTLSERLFTAQVLPYYLHQLDRVAGAAHFGVSDEHARSLHQELTACLSGYLVPRLVREIPGADSKTSI